MGVRFGPFTRAMFSVCSGAGEGWGGHLGFTAPLTYPACPLPPVAAALFGHILRPIVTEPTSLSNDLPQPSGSSAALPPPLVPQAAPRYWWAWFGLPALFILIADLVTKAMVFIPGRHEGDELAWWCELAWNRGMAWGLGASAPAVVLGLTVVLIPILIALWWRLYRRESHTANLAFGMILGGALGNAYDRVMTALATGSSGFQGVRDFIRIDLRMVGVAYTWPNFNVADAAISIGFVLLLLLPWITRRRAVAQPDLT